MRNKKAFMLGEHTLKVIIAVLCLLLLFYLLFRLYSGYQDEKNLGMAEATLNEIAEKMNEAKEKGDAGGFILNPVGGKYFTQGWWVIAWPYREESNKPLNCFGNYCICICGMGRSKERALEYCSSLGVCKDFDEEIKTINLGWFDWEWNEPIPIENVPLELKIKYDNTEGFKITEVAK